MEQTDIVEIEPELNVETTNKDLTTTEVTTNVVTDNNLDTEKQSNEKDNDNSDQDLLNEVTMCSFDLNTATCSSRKPIPFSRSKSSNQNELSQIRGISKATYTICSPNTVHHPPGPHFMSPSTSCATAGYLNPHLKICTSSDLPPKVSFTTPHPLYTPSPTRADSSATITTQPLGSFSNLPSPTSLIMNIANQPPSLFMQALSKLNENPVSLALLNKVLRSGAMETSDSVQSPGKFENTELSAPASLTSAPPSYSFVLRQMAARRPRLMGTFIPSPSFVQHTPPPNYAAAFDIYVEPTMPPQNPTRVYSFGFTSMPAVCPDCGYTGLTTVTAKITICTHLCAMFLCLFCCWACAPLPYVLRSCKDVYHYCTNCRNLLGIYCPTNPESTHL